METKSAPASWTLFDALPVPPIWVGVGVALILLGLLLVIVTASGELATFRAEEIRWWENRDARMAILIAPLAAAVLTVRRYFELAARRNLENLRVSIRWGEGRFDGIRRSFDRRDRGAMRLAGAVGILTVPVVSLLVDRDPFLYLNAWYWRPVVVWVWLMGGFAAWHGFRLFYEILSVARRFSDAAHTIPEIDLFDPRPLEPFARQGLHSTLPWLVLMAFFALQAMDRGYLWAIGVMGSISLAGAAVALVLPVLGVRQRVRAAKRAELERVHAALRGDASALDASLIGGRPGGCGVADLLAYRAFVRSAPEWPFDASAWLRFALYLAIPLGSWLGGAMVERLLDTALG